MASVYFDSSALVKYYIDETGSDWVAGILAAHPANEIVIAHTTGAEIIAAITRRTPMGLTTAADGAKAIRIFRGQFRSKYSLTMATIDVVEEAMSLAERHGLRG